MSNGTIIEASNVFYVRYCAGSTISATGKPRAIQKTHRLCIKDDRHYSRTCRAVKLLAQEFMLSINKGHDSVVGDDMKIVDFWEQRFLPYCEALVVGGRPRRKPATMRGYRQVWKQHLTHHFGSRTLQQYQAAWGSRFLDSLTGTQGKNTLRHVSALASSIFSRAVAEQRLKTNPWADVVFPADAVGISATPYYTWPEAEDVISALVDRPDCQLIMALACFAGLRPNEIVGLRWSDVDKEWIHIRRGYVRNTLDTPKTAESLRQIPLLPQVQVPLKLWRHQSGNPADGWLFPSQGTLTEERIIAPEMKRFAGGPSPIDLQVLAQRVIRPAVKAAGLKWKPLKAGRTGACTAIIERSNGNAALAQAVLGHKNMSTTTGIYKKQISPAAMLSGMKQLGE